MKKIIKKLLGFDKLEEEKEIIQKNQKRGNN